MFSRRATRRTVFTACALTALALVIVWRCDYFFSARQISFLESLPVLALFSAISFLMTIPFGYLSSRAGEFRTALSVDYLGSLFSPLVIILLPNLDFLLLVSVVIYLLVGVSVLVSDASGGLS